MGVTQEDFNRGRLQRTTFAAGERRIVRTAKGCMQVIHAGVLTIPLRYQKD
jgi:hypothetical protein